MTSSNGGNWYPIAKRGLDILFSGLLLIILVPFMILVSVIVLIAMGRPVLFTQTRIGRGGTPFQLYKFRTMKISQHNQLVNPSDDEMRLTSIGRLLRKTSIDELPELFNILRGDMSFVGPRPLLPEYVPLYSAFQARRHEVRPGLTGLAQVEGRNALDWPTRFRYDVDYVDSMSPQLDLKILLRTVLIVTTMAGVGSRSGSTMEPFKGEQ